MREMDATFSTYIGKARQCQCKDCSNWARKQIAFSDAPGDPLIVCDKCADEIAEDFLNEPQIVTIDLCDVSRDGQSRSS